MNVVVFGGSGYLGSHVADALTDAGHQVSLFDVTPSPYRRPTQKMIVADVLDPVAVDRALEAAQCAYNFAGIADLDAAAERPIDTVKQNVLGNAILLEAAVQRQLQRYVYASTVYVYSRAGGFYRCSKQSAELYIEEYARRYGLGYTILRYGTVYGPRADGRNSVYRYLHQALTTGRIVCQGTGEEMREYVHVKDAACLSVQALADEFANTHCLITGPHRMKFAELLEMIREILDNRVEIHFQPVSDDDVHYRLTPYSFTPKVAQKLVGTSYLDLGQGLLQCLADMYEVVGGRERAAGLEAK
ncbi:MAG TPA: NAD(P)-dependent oxidoreductase [Candidatus Acidoferrum sp.]|nr:NAD(P)-dependent oxidoreductase [Candidatus Acidoferrum sp.]